MTHVLSVVGWKCKMLALPHFDIFQRGSFILKQRLKKSTQRKGKMLVIKNVRKERISGNSSLAKDIWVELRK